MFETIIKQHIVISIIMVRFNIQVQEIKNLVFNLNKIKKIF